MDMNIGIERLSNKSEIPFIIKPVMKVMSTGKIDINYIAMFAVRVYLMLELHPSNPYKQYLTNP